MPFNARTRLGGANKKRDAGRTGYSGLEENLYRRENGRRKELLRRNEPGYDESQRPLPSRSASLIKGMQSGVEQATNTYPEFHQPAAGYSLLLRATVSER